MSSRGIWSSIIRFSIIGCGQPTLWFRTLGVFWCQTLCNGIPIAYYIESHGYGIFIKYTIP